MYQTKSNEEKALELARGLILHAYEGWINQRPWIDQKYWLERYGQFYELLQHCETGLKPFVTCDTCGNQIKDETHACAKPVAKDEK